jgi:hypothetical protein
MENIKELVKDVANKTQVIETFAAKVTKINTEENKLYKSVDAYTVDVMRTDGAIIKNVRLKASVQDKVEGLITIPKLGSWVLASVMDGVETRAYITQFSEVEKQVGRIKAPNDPSLFLDFSIDGDKLYLRYVKVVEKTPTTPEKIKELSKIEFDSTQNFRISHFNADAKKILDLSVAKEVVSLKFINAEGKELNSLVTTPENYNIILKNNQDKKETSLAIEKGKIFGHLFDANEIEKLTFELSSTEKAEIKLTESKDTILLEKDKIQLKKDDKNLIELKGKTGINIKTEGEINMEGKSVNIKATDGDTIISGTNVKIN